MSLPSCLPQDEGGEGAGSNQQEGEGGGGGAAAAVSKVAASGVRTWRGGEGRGEGTEGGPIVLPYMTPNLEDK